jgi:hypothetical protein
MLQHDVLLSRTPYIIQHLRNDICNIAGGLHIFNLVRLEMPEKGITKMAGNENIDSKFFQKLRHTWCYSMGD